jgi:hypothetical protein
MGVWITTGGSSVWGHAFHLPLTDVLCQTSRMRKLTATICLTIAVLLGMTGCANNSYENTLAAYAEKVKAPKSYWCGIALPIEIFRHTNVGAAGELYRLDWIRKYEKEHGGGWMSCRPTAGSTNNWKSLVNYCEQKNVQKKC